MEPPDDVPVSSVRSVPQTVLWRELPRGDDGEKILSPGRGLTTRCRDALVLRDRALALLVDDRPGVASDRGSEPKPAATALSEASWRLFLRSERCARPLSRAWSPPPRIASRGAQGDEMRVRRSVETQRVLAGRARLADLDRIAARLGVRIVVLKGGVLLPGPGALDLGDLDLLTRPERAEEVAAALDRGGYRAEEGAGLWHLAKRSAGGGVPVEVHFTLSTAGESAPEPLIRRSVRMEGTERLWRLEPREHLWHVLHHGVVEHPDRRGRLRDLLLTARAWAECSREERRAVRERSRRHPQSGALLGQLAMAESLAAGRTPEDRFREGAAGHYLLWSLLHPLGLPDTISAALFNAVVARLGSRADRKVEWRRQLRLPRGPSGYRGVGPLERLAPGLGRSWRVGLRLVRRALVAGAAVPLAGAARRIAEKRGPGGGAVPVTRG